ncbi:hypothetical protein ANTQUA_LOCUS60 [Anthophora quadrimaculata]
MSRYVDGTLAILRIKVKHGKWSRRSDGALCSMKRNDTNCVNGSGRAFNDDYYYRTGVLVAILEGWHWMW